MAKSGASKGAKRININSGNTERDGVNAHVAKTPSQIYKTQQLNKIKSLTNQGKHKDAQKLYQQTFPGV